jgi:hypothetical protein
MLIRRGGPKAAPSRLTYCEQREGFLPVIAFFRFSSAMLAFMWQSRTGIALMYEVRQ